MKILMLSDDRILEGTPTQIVETMRSLAFVEHTTLSAYIDWVVSAASRMTDVQMVIKGDNDEARAASFVEAMLTAGLATNLEELNADAKTSS